MLKFGDFQTPPPPLYAFKQNCVIKTDVRFCLDPIPSPLERTYFVDGPYTLLHTFRYFYLLFLSSFR